MLRRLSQVLHSQGDASHTGRGHKQEAKMSMEIKDGMKGGTAEL
jgi:hypothetical protein